MTTIEDVASIVRSKNAGPYQVTFDIFFQTEQDYERVVSLDAITRSSIAERFNIQEADVGGIYELDRLHAIKISIKRTVPAGDIEDSDIYGAQQYTPLLNIQIDGQT